MPTKLTKDQQWKTVAQGLALGCLALGMEELPAAKMTLELAFSAAWRTWSRAASFPSVSPRDFFVYVQKSSRRTGTYAAWDWQAALVPYLTIDGWEVRESLEVFTEDETVTAGEWTALARLFLDAQRV